MKRRILIVDDEVTVLLTLKAVLEISGFDVETAASAREAKARIKSREYHMVITDMRMENDAAGVEVIETARTVDYHPAVALLTSFPVADEDWQLMGADRMLVKPMHTRELLMQIENLMLAHEAKLAAAATSAKKPVDSVKKPAVKKAAKKVAAKKAAAKKPAKRAPAKKLVSKKKPAKKSAAKRPAVRKQSAKKTAKRKR